MVGFGWWGYAKKGLSVDDEKQQKARRLLEKGSDKVGRSGIPSVHEGCQSLHVDTAPQTTMTSLSCFLKRLSHAIFKSDAKALS